MTDELVEGYSNPVVDIITNEQNDPEWLVEGMLLQGWMGCLAGAPSAGKSYISYTLGLAMASGMPALNGLIPAASPRRVVYFDQENSETDRAKYISRIYWGLTHQNKCEPDLALLHQNFLPVGFWLGDHNWDNTVERFMLAYKPHAVIFDTATVCFNITNENDNAEAGQIINRLTRLQRMVNPVATFIILRHENARRQEDKNQRRTMRGAKAWLGSTHGTIYVIRTAGRPRKHNLFLSRIEPDKTRAYGLNETIFITPEYIGDKTDEKRALVLHGTNKADKEHKKKLAEEGEDE